MWPLDQGFDTYYGVLHNLNKFETVFFDAEGGMPILRGDRVETRPADPAQITSLYTREALAFIDKNRERPFFLYLAHAMPHIPFDALSKFNVRSGRGLYGDAVEELDNGTGRILERLRSLGLDKTTLVLFTSDNGPERNTPGSAAPLRGTKHTVYEGGLRVPFLSRWPGKVPAGRTCGQFVNALDILPTLARIMGEPVKPPRPLDGFDVSPVLLGEENAKSPRQTLFALYGLNKNRRESIRSGNWKLRLSDPPELNNLAADLAESRNLAAEHEEIEAKMKSQYAAWFADVANRWPKEQTQAVAPAK